jgi:hypothetical protein
MLAAPPVFIFHEKFRHLMLNSNTIPIHVFSLSSATLLAKMAAFMLKTSSRLLICFENVFKIPIANYAKPAGGN